MANEKKDFGGVSRFLQKMMEKQICFLLLFASMPGADRDASHHIRFLLCDNKVWVIAVYVVEFHRV